MSSLQRYTFSHFLSKQNTFLLKQGNWQQIEKNLQLTFLWQCALQTGLGLGSLYFVTPGKETQQVYVEARHIELSSTASFCRRVLFQPATETYAGTRKSLSVKQPRSETRVCKRFRERKKKGNVHSAQIRLHERLVQS